MFKHVLLKWMPHKEQSVCERRLIRAMKDLKIEDFHFNWDRDSCYIEFHFHEDAYKLEHSLEKAKRKGIILKNGLDCLIELTQSLEDLCVIIDRGTYDFETWISGMKQPSPLKAREVHEDWEEDYFEYNKEKFNPFDPDAAHWEVDRNEVIQRAQRK